MLTKHAENRLENRAIPPLVVDLLYRFGAEKPQAGSTILFFDHRARRRAYRALKDVMDRFEKVSQTYVIESADNGQLITAGHRFDRLRNK